VTPAQEAAPPGQTEAFLTNGTTVAGEAPFNMQEAVRSISGLVDQGQKTMKDMDKAINSVNNSLLDATTLSNFVSIMTNFQAVTADAAGMSKEVRGMLDTNVPAVHVAISNFAALGQKLDEMADKLDRTISTNSDDTTAAVKNIKAASASLKDLAEGLQAGHGLAGSLLKDEKLKMDFQGMITNISYMTEQIGAFSRRLNDSSLWHVLFHKPAPTNAPGR
jgi:ABC-type transporter Mla subunit MlaD